MRLLICLILSVIGLASYGKAPHEFANGTYYNEVGSKLIEIKNDTLILRSSSITEGEQGTLLAICRISTINDSFFEINSIEGSVLSAFKDVLITEEVQDDNTFSKISFEVPNTNMEIRFNVYCGTSFYSSTVENGVCSIILNRNQINAPKSFIFTFQPISYTESNPAGQFFGVLYYEYPYRVDLKDEKNIVIKLPNVSDILFEQYYLLGEYVQIMPYGIKWRGEFFEKKKE